MCHNLFKTLNYPVKMYQMFLAITVVIKEIEIKQTMKSHVKLLSYNDVYFLMQISALVKV